MKHNDLPDAALLADEARYCSFGDTVHYVDPPKLFARITANGSFSPWCSVSCPA